MSRVVLIAKGPKTHCATPAPSNLVVVERLAALTRHTHHITRCSVHVKAITQHTRSQRYPVPDSGFMRKGVGTERNSPCNVTRGMPNPSKHAGSTPAVWPPFTHTATHWRCFSQFDRKTDCFGDSANENLQGHSYLWAARAKPSEGAPKLGSMLELDDRVITGPRGFESRAALLVERSLRDLKRGVSTRLSSCRIMKAVCGTQTRMPRGFKSATRDVFRPERTGLRKTPSSWLPANERQKGHPGFTVSRTGSNSKAPFLVGVYDLDVESF